MKKTRDVVEKTHLPFRKNKKSRVFNEKLRFTKTLVNLGTN